MQPSQPHKVKVLDVSDDPAPAPDAPYIVAMPPFSKVYAFSDNGRVLIGDFLVSGGPIWTKSAGFVPLSSERSLYGYGASALSSNGEFIAGQFNYNNKDYGMFRWSASHGVEQLNPHMGSLFDPRLQEFTDGISPPIRISDDGTKISFFCSNGMMDACESGTSPDQRPLAEKLWIQGKGFVNLGEKFRNKFDYIRLADDFKTYLVSTQNPPTLGRIDSNGTYTPFQHFREPLYKYVDMDPDKEQFIMNRDASVVAEEKNENFDVPMIWNATGQLLRPLTLIPGCKRYAVVAIDNTGNIFVNAICPELVKPYDAYLSPVGLRVTPEGTQTISDWLAWSGLPNHLPVYTAIKLVSGDGKTIFGVTGGPTESAMAGPGNSEASETKTSPVGSAVIGFNTAFVAHVP